MKEWNDLVGNNVPLEIVLAPLKQLLPELVHSHVPVKQETFKLQVEKRLL
jgi:hypothetical protein